MNSSSVKSAYPVNRSQNSSRNLSLNSTKTVQKKTNHQKNSSRDNTYDSYASYNSSSQGRKAQSRLFF